MNDRLPYTDVSIATVLVVLGVALAAYPWLEGGALVVLVAGMIAIGALGLAALRRPKNVVSGQIPWS